MKILHHISAFALLLGTVVGASGQGWNEGKQSSNRIECLQQSSAGLRHLRQADSKCRDRWPGRGERKRGGIATSRDHVAVVNFGSQTIAILQRTKDGFQLKQVVSTASSPFSVAFGHDHLYILGGSTVESHQVFDYGVSSTPDGSATLVKADGSAAQVGILENQLIITEKSNAIETVNLNTDGAIVGATSLIANIPANVNAPFGLVTRDDDAYVTIAHADEISLVRDDAVVTVTGSGTQHAPCWLALDGPFLFSSNSPSMTISRYLVYGQKIIQQVAVAATLERKSDGHSPSGQVRGRD